MALRRLIEGNERFVRGEARAQTANPADLVQLAEGQHPFAAILGCSDSRVPPELIFDQGFGDLFIVRVAGNVASAETLGSLGYALKHLRVPLFVVLGHERCGAVQAALQAKLRGPSERGNIAELLDAIIPGLEDVDATTTPDVQMRQAVEANVHWTLQQLRSAPGAQLPLAEGQVQLAGAVYELATGRVRFVAEE